MSGPQRIISWRVLDAQFFGVAQRRRRVFVVASSRKDFDPAAVLFELNSVRRDTPPRRETQQEVASYAGKRSDVGSHWDNPANPHPALNQSNNIGGIGASNQEIFSQRGSGLVSDAYSDISRTLLAKENDSTAKDLDTYFLAYGGGNTGGNIDVATACTAHGVRMDFDTETFAVHGTQDPDTNHELAHTLGRDHGQENAVCYGFKPGQGSKAGGIGWAEEQAPTLTSAQSGTNLAPAIAFAENSRGEIRLQGGDGQIAGPLSTGGGKPGQGFPAIAFSYKDHGADASIDMSPTLRAGNHDTSHANSGQPPAICIQHASIGRQDAAGPQGKGYQEDVAFTQDSRPSADVVQFGMQVRRLTPVECERLQGFPDNHTLIPWRGKAATDCPDGPRYKAIGNSMAVPVMRWIGERIQQVVAEAESFIAVSPYCQNLNKLRARPTHMLADVGDQWRTPDDLWWGINARFGPFVLDLFADNHNAKCEDFYTAEDNALTQDWSARLAELGGAAYANPPYSRASRHEGQYITGMTHIMQHTMAMREAGGRYVFLIKAATSESWWPENADHIAFIRGRVGFELPDWFIPADEKQKPSGAFFAGAIAVFDKSWKGPAISYVGRDELEAMGRMFISQIRCAALNVKGIAA